MSYFLFLLTFALPCVLSTLHAEPGILWELPATLKENPDHPPASQQVAVQWLNDEEIVAVRRGGVAGRYNCGKKAVVWENKFEHLVRGCAVSPDALYLVIESPEVLETLSRFALSDGMLQVSHSRMELSWGADVSRVGMTLMLDRQRNRPGISLNMHGAPSR